MTTTTTTRTVWQLARLAECADPDTLTSPGAEWLARVARDADDLAYEGGDEDGITERADALVPIGTHARWRVFADLAAYEEDLSDFGADASDLTACAGMALFLIAERLLAALLAEAGEDE